MNVSIPPCLRHSLPSKRAPRRPVLKWEVGFGTCLRSRGCTEEVCGGTGMQEKSLTAT